MDLHVPVTARDHVRGAPHGRVTLVEYGDFDCPFCAEAYPVVRALLGQFEKQLRFVFRHNPRGELHPHGRLAAQAAEAAAQQGKFWPMHDLLFEHTSPLEEHVLLSYARSLELEQSKFEADLHSSEIRAHVRQDEVGGLRSGVIGTPTFFINGMQFRDKPDLARLGGALTALIESGS
jgi:protein-disulfide isomerase